MFKKRLKGLLAMALAGSIALSALPLTASATISGTISVWDGLSEIATIDPSEITSSGFSSGYLNEHPDYLTANNMWAVASDYSLGLGSGSVNATFSGNNLAGKLYDEYIESATIYRYTSIKYSHKYVVTTDNPGTADIDTNNAQTNAQTATTFPVNVSSPDPLKSITEYTVWYGVLSGSFVYSSAVVQADHREIEPADSISIPMSAFGGLYTSSAGYNEWNRFQNGVTLIQVGTEYKTLNIPVLNGLGEQEMNGENPYTLSVTKDCDEYLDDDENRYFVGYTKQNGEVVLSDYPMNNKQAAWAEIEAFAANDPNFDVNTLFFLRLVNVWVYKDSTDIGYFTSRALYPSLATNDTENLPDAYKYIVEADDNSIWLTDTPQKFVLGKDLLEVIGTYLDNNPDTEYMDLTETTEIIVTGTEPVPYESTQSYEKSPLYVETVPATISDHADVLEKAGALAAGNKCDTSGWQLWGCGFISGDVDEEDFIIFLNKSTLESTNGVNSIGIDQLNTLTNNSCPLIYFPQVAIAPAVTVIAPAFNAVPAPTATIPANDGYSVESVKWFDGTTELAAGDTFDCEKQYTVEVTLQPDTGLSFIASTAATINGVEPTEKTLNNDGTLTVTYTFPATEKNAVSAVEFTVDAPVLGGAPDVTADVAAGANYTASAVAWTPADAAFKADTAYTAAVTLTPNAGYKFTENTTAKVNGVAVTPVLNPDGTLTVSYTFAKLSSGSTSGSTGGTSRPSRPTRPVTPSEPNPSIGGSSMSWSDIADYLGKLPDGSEVTIDLNGSTNIPIEVIKAIDDRDLKVEFVIDGARSWKTDGKDIKNPGSADLTITKTTGTKTTGLDGILGTQFSLNGTGIPTSIEIIFKTTHAGKTASLFKIENGKSTLISRAVIGADGKVVLPNATEKGDYVVMIGEPEDIPGDVNGDGVVNILDAVAIAEAGISGKTIPLSTGDFNGDGEVNIFDAVAIAESRI